MVLVGWFLALGCAVPGPGPSPNPVATDPPPRPAQAPAFSPAPKGPLRELLEAHNRARALHCTPPLRWSPELASTAQAWAEALARRGCLLEHSHGRYGENLAAGTTSTLSAGAVADLWYAESAQYRFDRPGFSMQTGHFTQMVWIDSKGLGCGIAQCSDLDVWVCHYDPPGNVEGRYEQNVLPTTCRR